MTVDVYIDILFLLNAVMDALCLRLTAHLLHRKLPLLRVCVAAILGGSYAVISLFLNVPGGQIMVIGIDIIVCMMLCLCAFGRKNAKGKQFLLLVAVYFAISMVMGGIMTALYHLLNRLGLPAWLGEMQGEDGLSAFIFALLALIGGLVTAWGGRVFRRANAVTVCRVDIRWQDRSVSLAGMVDSGNLLRDPIGGRPVITVDRSAASPLLSPTLTAALISGDFMGSPHLSAEEVRCLRFIPTGTATGQSLLTAILPDEITITPEGKAPHPAHALIALTDLPHAPAEALVPTELII